MMLILRLLQIQSIATNGKNLHNYTEKVRILVLMLLLMLSTNFGFLNFDVEKYK